MSSTSSSGAAEAAHGIADERCSWPARRGGGRRPEIPVRARVLVFDLGGRRRDAEAKAAAPGGAADRSEPTEANRRRFGRRRRGGRGRRCGRGGRRLGRGGCSSASRSTVGVRWRSASRSAPVSRWTARTLPLARRSARRRRSEHAARSGTASARTSRRRGDRASRDRSVIAADRTVRRRCGQRGAVYPSTGSG